jgi:hypothetical protein
LTEVELTRDTLIVHVRGMDRLWSLKSRLEIPLSHVLDAEADTQVVREWQKGLRAPGTHVPGVITAGTFFSMVTGCSGRCTIRRRPSSSGSQTSVTRGS